MSDMSFSLRLNNGDLALEGRSFATVTGSKKLVQDLKCAILTELGTYPEQPEFGSNVEDLIGQSDQTVVSTMLQAEINRICKNYQSQQIARNNRDSASYGRITITPEEALLAIDSIETFFVENKVLARVTITTAAGQTNFNITVSS